jgi:predicted TIM-barrel fold metal-dependent hydrolase
VIIDAHYHLVEDGFFHDAWWEGIGRTYQGIMRAGGSELPGDPLDIGRGVAAASAYDPGGARMLGDMAAAGIDATVFLALDYGLRTGEGAVPIVEQNRRVADIARANPGRVIPLFTIDPRRDGALDALRQAVEEWGMKGLKLHCSAGFFPHDEVCHPLYAYCQERGLPVLLHTGNQPPPMKARYTMPEHVDDVAADYGDLTIVCAHLAFAWHPQLLSLAAVKPNIHMDFSGWQRSFHRHPEELLGILRRIVDEIGAHRVLWGSDGPYLNVLMPVAEWRSSFEGAAREHGFTEAELGQLMGGAAAAVYGDARPA